MEIEIPAAGGQPVERLALTPTEAAKALGIGRTLVYELLAAGKLPGRRLNDRWIVPVDALRAWLSESQDASDG